MIATNMELTNDFYASTIGALKRDLANKNTLKAKVKKLEASLVKNQSLYVKMIDAQKVLSTISDDNTEQTLSLITGMVNKALAEIFSGDVRRISLRKKLYGDSKPHIVLELRNGEGDLMNMTIQNGAGLRQVVSFMYAICLIEIRKGRRLLLLDERLNGLHYEAKRILSEIISIFAEGGFQFLFVEYGLNGIGKMYNVEKRGDEAKLVSLDGKEYTDTMVFSDEVDLSVLDENYVEETEEGLVGEMEIV